MQAVVRRQPAKMRWSGVRYATNGRSTNFELDLDGVDAQRESIQSVGQTGPDSTEELLEDRGRTMALYAHAQESILEAVFDQ
jgi:hypothetical protein